MLSPAAIRTLSGVASKKRLFTEIAEIAAAVHGVSAAATMDGLQEREVLGATGVGHGVAIPHARLHGLDKCCGVFLRLDRPVDYEAVDRLPVDLVFALLAPTRSGADHLKALATVSRRLREPELRERLRANADPAALHALLTDEQRRAA